MLPLLLLACATNPPQVAQEPSPASPPAATDAPVAAKTEKPPTPTTVREAPRPKGHCSSGELAYFDCAAGDQKHLSLCGSADLSPPTAFLSYRYGPLGAPELVYPESPRGSLERFHYEARAHVRSQGDTVHFDNGSFRYTVMAMSGSGHPGEGAPNNFVGVMVEEDGKSIATVTCTGTAADQLAKLAPQ
ncbi:MAG: hypothetical protein KC912_08905 [Proteobacteria bacterium]|nr:hypothetical protein [Pseudomonadota bacterium]